MVMSCPAGGAIQVERAAFGPTDTSDPCQPIDFKAVLQQLAIGNIQPDGSRMISINPSDLAAIKDPCPRKAKTIVGAYTCGVKPAGVGFHGGGGRGGDHGGGGGRAFHVGGDHGGNFGRGGDHGGNFGRGDNHNYSYRGDDNEDYDYSYYDNDRRRFWRYNDDSHHEPANWMFRF